MRYLGYAWELTAAVAALYIVLGKVASAMARRDVRRRNHDRLLAEVVQFEGWDDDAWPPEVA